MAGGTKAAAAVKLAAPDLAPSKAKYVLQDSAFAAGCLGGKSNNLQLLRKPEAKALLGDAPLLRRETCLCAGRGHARVTA